MKSGSDSNYAEVLTSFEEESLGCVVEKSVLWGAGVTVGKYIE